MGKTLRRAQPVKKTLSKAAPKKSLSKAAPKPEAKTKSLPKKKKASIDLAQATGPIPSIPSKVKGKKYRLRDERFLLAMPEDMPADWPRPHIALPPDTFWRIPKKWSWDRVCLVTVLPDGVHVAHDMCGVCHNIAYRCICRTGFLAPRGIEYMYISSLARTEGEPFESAQDTTAHKVTSRGRYWYRAKVRQETGVGHVVRRPQASGGVQVQKTLSKPSKTLSRPAKKTLSKAEPFSLAKTEVAAVQGEGKATQDALAALDRNAAPKTLKKKRLRK